MYVLERSAIIPLSLEETWEVFYANELRDVVELSDSIIAVRDYRVRENGTPEYVMVNRAGPMKSSHRSDYVVYERPLRTVDEVLDSPLGGRFLVDHEPVDGGTLVRHRWEVEPHGPMRLLFPLIRPLMARAFRADLDLISKRLRERSEGKA